MLTAIVYCNDLQQQDVSHIINNEVNLNKTSNAVVNLVHTNIGYSFINSLCMYVGMCGRYSCRKYSFFVGFINKTVAIGNTIKDIDLSLFIFFVNSSKVSTKTLYWTP